MFRKILAIISSAMILCGFAACSLTERDVIEVTKSTEVPPKMMFLGDSIAAGYGLDGYTDNDNYNCASYSNILNEQYKTELLDICPHEMQNFAVSGATSADLLKLLNSGKLDSALAQTDAVVVSIGGNDMLGIMLNLLNTLGFSSENKSIDLEELDFFKAAAALAEMDEKVDEALVGFETNLQDISNQINEKTSGTLYIQTLYNPLETLDNIPMAVDFSEEKLTKFNNIIKNNSEGNYEVIDIAADFKGKCGEFTRIGEFDIHPNEKGHEVIAETVDESFRNTGFTYKGQEYGEPHLTALAIILIVAGIAGIILVLLIIPKLFRKKE